ncbi:MAG: DUF2237 domain-containing protein [Gammaproteobacteria bacterium]|nr:DUF2237 domain-containing protein [Gammaproteobacteria bacterium]MDH3857936.1 DUF2237 domain-containing protein [Gammaproteobacteria bacterium]
MNDSKNVFGEALEPYGQDPATGFYRDGCCNTGAQDHGSHTVCASLSDEFLEYSLGRGNDLITERPEFGFPGLKAGDCWCLCAGRWLEAHQDGKAPRVYLKRTHEAALDTVPLNVLREYALDLT